MRQEPCPFGNAYALPWLWSLIFLFLFCILSFNSLFCVYTFFIQKISIVFHIKYSDQLAPLLFMKAGPKPFRNNIFIQLSLLDPVHLHVISVLRPNPMWLVKPSVVLCFHQPSGSTCHLLYDITHGPELCFYSWGHKVKWTTRASEQRPVLACRRVGWPQLLRVATRET